MATAIEMASNALLLIGDNPISSFNEAGAGATVAKNLYENAYETALSYHPWTFALKEQKLNQTSFTPDQLTNYQYAYQMPSDHIRVWAVFPHSDYTIVGDKLYSNENELLMRYVYEIDEQLLPPVIVEAIQYKLAALFSISVTEDPNKHMLYENLYEKSIIKASSVDSQGKPPMSPADKPFVDVRMGSYGFRGNR